MLKNKAGCHPRRRARKIKQKIYIYQKFIIKNSYNKSLNDQSKGRHIEIEHISMVNDKLKAFKYYVYRRTDVFLKLSHLPYFLCLTQLL